MTAPHTAAVEALIKQLEANRSFYQTAARNATEERLGELFGARARQRAEFAEALAAEEWLDHEASHDRAEQAPAEALQRGLTTVRAAMTIEPDKTDQLLLADAQQAEAELLKVYRAALASGAPRTLAGILEEQFAQIEAAYARIAALGREAGTEMVLALFDTVLKAEAAADALALEGFGPGQVSLLAHEKAVSELVEDRRGRDARDGATAGAAQGAAVGGLLGLAAGASTAIVIGVGTVLTGGALAAVLGLTALGAGIGASYGGLFGALLGWGISEQDVQTFVEGVRQGKLLVAVETDVAARDRAAEILETAGAQLVAARQQEPAEPEDG